MREKPYTPGELFDAVCSRIQLPAFLDYGNAASGDFHITNSNFSIHSSLDYGGSEGIYLDLWLHIVTNGEIKDVPLGTFKTLDENAVAMRTMGLLLADFIVGCQKLWNDCYDDFEWTGWLVKAYDSENTCRRSLYVHSEADLKQLLKKLLLDSGHAKVIVRNNENRKEEEYTYKDVITEDC